MKYHVLSLFPEAFQSYLESSIIGKAIERGLIEVNLIDIRDYAFNKHKSCDDAPYGGGPGMLMTPEPIAEALEDIPAVNKRTIFVTPSGKPFNQEYARQLVQEEEIVILCGHYEGIDQRIIDSFVTDEISIGDYVLTSGVIPAEVIIDSVSRLVRGVIKEDSHTYESFHKGLLEYPQYTRPEVFREVKVPEVLLSGHHANIDQWRLKESMIKTLKNRPELINVEYFTKDEKKLLEEIQHKGDSHELNKKA